jgi:acetyl esterase
MNKTGAVAAAILAVASFRVHQLWNRREGLFYNLFMILHGPVSSAPLFGPKTVEEQAAFLDSLTALQETATTNPFAKYILGEELASGSQGPNASIQAEIQIPSRDKGRTIPVLCARPVGSEGKQLPLILYFYAGGLIIGSPKTEAFLIRYLAKKANALVCALNYRKPPLHPYPATTNDVVDFSLYLLEHGVQSNPTENPLLESLGVSIDPTQVATFGTSAGGYLSAMASRLLTAQNVSIQLQVSLIPMAKPHGGTQSMIRNIETDVWDRHWNAYAWSVYLPNDDGTLVQDWRVNLLVDPPSDVIDRLPPVYLQINQRDILFDEGRMFKERLEQQSKLIEFVQVDTTHIGGSPPFSIGGPGEGTFQRAAEFVGSFFQKQAIN